jgi:hypothetical protein
MEAMLARLRKAKTHYSRRKLVKDANRNKKFIENISQNASKKRLTQEGLLISRRPIN